MQFRDLLVSVPGGGMDWTVPTVAGVAVEPQGYRVSLPGATGTEVADGETQTDSLKEKIGQELIAFQGTRF